MFKHVFYLLLVAASLASNSHADNAKKAIIFDTDMAIDDWLSLLYLEKNSSIDIRAITVSNSGESHCQAGLDNATNLLKLVSNRSVPIACGDDYPLDGYFVFPQPWRLDSDTLSGIDMSHWLQHPSANVQASLHAADLIHQTIINSDQPLTIVAVGPLTNIAQWLQRYPDDQSKVAELIMMGGSYQQGGNIIVPKFTAGHPNTVSEWNYFIDPLATQIVLSSALDKTMVGLDVTNKVRVTHGFADALKLMVSDPAGQFVDRVMDNNRWFIDTGEYYFWDVMAAIVSANPTLCEGPDIALTAVVEKASDTPYLGTSDLTMPASAASGKARQHLNAANAGQVVAASSGPTTKVCMNTRPADVFTEFQTIISQP